MSEDVESGRREEARPEVEGKISQLGPNSRQVNVHVKVLSKSPPREVISRMDNSTRRVSDILVGDETGCILMTLWDDDIDRVKESEVVYLKNGYVSLFKGSMRLNKGRYGTFETPTKEIPEVNRENNLSDRHFEEERRYPTFRPLYGGMDRDRRGGGGGRGGSGGRRPFRRRY